jgi:hypothetical protein
MGHVSFPVGSGEGTIAATVNVYGELSLSDFDPAYEEMLMAMSGSTPPAYFLWQHWDDIVRGFGFGDEDAGWLLGTLLSKVPELVEKMQMAKLAEDDDPMSWSEVARLGLGRVLSSSFTVADERRCDAILGFVNSLELNNWFRTYDTHSEVMLEKSWKKDFVFQRSIELGEEETIIGPWNVFGTAQVANLFWLNESIVTVRRSGGDYDPVRLALLDKVFRSLFPKRTYKFDEVEPDNENVHLILPEPVAAAGAEFGLLYTRIRPHKHEAPGSPCYEGSPLGMFMPYFNRVDLAEAFTAAEGLNAEKGSCYDIRMMRRIEGSAMEWDEIEAKLTQGPKDHSKIGGYLDWLAQNWEEL